MTLIIGRAIDTAGSGDFLQQCPRRKGVSVGGHDAHSLAHLYSGDFSGDLNRPERTDSSAETVSFEDFPVRIESSEVGDILTVGIHERQYGKSRLHRCRWIPWIPGEPYPPDWQGLRQ